MIDKKSIDKLVGDYKGLSGKPFEKRIAAFEKFHNPKEQTFESINRHVLNVTEGEPGNQKNPGAYTEGYKMLDSILANPDDKFSKDDDIERVIEAYVDRFLDHVSPSFKKSIAEARKQGLDEKQLRKLKGSLFAQYHTSNEGRLNPFADEFIDRFRGKTKLQADAELRVLMSNTQKLYSQYLVGSATKDLITEEDRFKLAPYVQKKFEAAGITHDDHLLTKDVGILAQDYQVHLSQGNMAERGYKRLEKKKAA